MTMKLWTWGLCGVAGLWALGCGGSSSSPTPDGGPPDGGLTSGNPIGLWVGGFYALTATELAVSGSSPSPADECSDPNSGAATTPAAFDAQGNLWLEQASDQALSIIEWTAAQLAAACSSGVPARTVTLQQGGACGDLAEISAFAFDPQGSLWLSFTDTALLLGLSADQLQSTATVTPTYCLINGSSYAAALSAPTGMAFDASGNLWVANIFSVLEYTPATLAGALLATGGSAIMPPPDAYLSTVASENAAQVDNAGLSANFEYVAFDAAGNLWVSGENWTGVAGSNFIAEYPAAVLTTLGASTTPTPAVTLIETEAQAAAFDVFFGPIAFDSAGNLFLGAGGQIFRYPAANLTPSGSGAYDVDISDLPFLTGTSLVFNPIPSGLPINP